MGSVSMIRYGPAPSGIIYAIQEPQQFCSKNVLTVADCKADDGS